MVCYDDSMYATRVLFWNKTYEASLQKSWPLPDRDPGRRGGRVLSRSNELRVAEPEGSQVTMEIYRLDAL